MKINIENRKVFVDENGIQLSHETSKQIRLFIRYIQSANLLGDNSLISDQACMRIIEFIRTKPWEKDPNQLNELVE